MVTAATESTEIMVAVMALATAAGRARWPGMARGKAGAASEPRRLAASDISGRNMCPVSSIELYFTVRLKDMSYSQFFCLFVYV